MKEKEESIKGKPLSIKGMSFEGTVAELLRRKPAKEDKQKHSKKNKAPDTKR